MVGAGLGPPGPPQAGRLPRLLQPRDPSKLAGSPVAPVLLAKNHNEAAALLELQLASELLGEGGMEAGRSKHEDRPDLEGCSLVAPSCWNLTSCQITLFTLLTVYSM